MRLTIANIWTLLSNRGRQFLDGRRVNTIQELHDALQSWESTEGSLFPDDAPRPARFQPRQTSAYNCFKCGKQGHKVAECFSSNRSMSGGNEQHKQSDKNAITCFSCGQVGHKSPECPSQVMGKKFRGTEKEIYEELLSKQLCLSIG